MTVTSVRAAAPAPGSTRAPTRGPRPDTPSRPTLRLVPSRRRRTRTVITLTTIVVFAVLFATAAVHTTIVSAQRNIDRMEVQAQNGARRNQALRLQVAELESPGRVVEAARADGMEVPAEVTWLTPAPDGSSEVSDDAAPIGGDGGVTDERAAADPTSPDGETGGAAG